MPKIFVAQENFVDMNVYTRRYDVRYKIISDNKNNFSNWSPIFEVSPEIVFQRGTIEVPGYSNLIKASQHVNVTWDSVSLYKEIDGALKYLSKLQHYDIWVKWAGTSGANPGEWFYQERISATSLNIPIPDQYVYISNPSTGALAYDTPKYLYVEVYRPGKPVIRYNETRSFIQDSTTVDVSNDLIYFPTGHGSSTGTPGLYLSATPIGGLSNNTTYYTRTISYYQIALYASLSDSLTDTNRIDLTGTPSGTGSFTGYPFRMYDNLITTL